jgi:glutathione peroxidase
MALQRSIGAAVCLVLGAGSAWAQTTPPKEKPVPPATKPDATPKPAEKSPATDAKPAAAKESPMVLRYTMKTLDGKPQELSAYKGKVVVLVNVASKCGYTGQYASLEKLYEEKKDQGLVILGFPANEFGSQEPGSNSEIASFCASTYHVTFPMFEKISVKGPEQHPLYKQLAAQPAPIGGDPKWNFTKFVVDREGRVVARYDAKGAAGDRAALEPELLKKIDELLGAKKPDAKAPDTGAPSGS